MALAPGSRLGVYEVTAAIGEGGMGQVWRATDTTLGRQVAIKILPDAFASDPDRLARFEREAKTLASLNHPHIAAIYAVERSAALNALVMELVEGEDLAQRLQRGAIPLDEALPIAKQIAEALEAAHEQGIIHRDLKPANIKLRADGTVKVLDFGLAKAMDPGASSSAISMSPTITTPAMTQAGMILGTAAYMSPEQARGKIVDKRSDVWAFGAVLYEMLAGVRPFDGEDTTEVIAAVVKTTPDWSTLPADVPRPIVTLIQRCLEKDRKARVGDIAVAKFTLAESATLAVSAPAATTSPPPARSAVSRALPWLSSAAALAFAALWLTAWTPFRVEPPPDRPLVRLDVDLGAGVVLPPPRTGRSSVAISPDGMRIAYVSGTPTRLYTRRLDQPLAVVLPGTEGASEPFFSPDGRWLAFFSAAGLNKVSVDGGAVVPVFTASGDNVGASRGGSWAADGTILVGTARASGTQRGLLRIPISGSPDTVGDTAEGELGLFSPTLLPGGHAVLIAVDNLGAVDRTVIEAITLADQRRTKLVQGGASPRFLATSRDSGHLVYVANSTLFAVPFDPKTLEMRGTGIPIVDDVASNSLVGSGEFDVSDSGTLVYRRGSDRASGSIVQWTDSSSKTAPLMPKPARVLHMSVSPDGGRLALVLVDGRGSDIWVYDARRDVLTRLTFGGAPHRYPRWSPDGRFVVYAAEGIGVRIVRADGGGEPQTLTASKGFQYPWSFRHDGKRLAYWGAGSQELWTLPLEEQGGLWKAGTPERVSTKAGAESRPAFSPDGRWLAYQSGESGRQEIYVRSFPASPSATGRWQISTNGGAEPTWSRNGRELAYRLGGQVLTVRYTVSGDSFVADKPQGLIPRLGGEVWDLSPDGKRVAVVTPEESGTDAARDHQVVFLFNFFDELRRRVPLGK